MAATITDYITRDLKERIVSSNGSFDAEPLTLARLAAHYGVSQTPVRLAVSALVDEKILCREGNGRLSLNAGVRAGLVRGGAAAARPLPMPLDWETRLLQNIVSKSLMGRSGGHPYLREEAMARHCGVGRTMLRQAFSRLAGKGLLEHVPRCGWRVRTFDGKEMGHYLIAREAMELTALDLARHHLVPADLERMLAGNTPLSPQGPPRLDNSLHQYWIGKAGNPYIQEFLDRHGVYYTTLFDFAAPEAHLIREMAEQHRSILTALLSRDWAGAKEALSDHIRSQQPVVKLLMERLAACDRDACPEE